MLQALRERVRHLQGETLALYHAARHPATPWYAKLFVAAVVAYAVSPIDLIPDFIPVLGVLDDLILVPLGIVVAIWVGLLAGHPSRSMIQCSRRSRPVMNPGSAGVLGRKATPPPPL